MVLIDTSSWINLLRPNGNPVVRQRVEQALREGLASWCPQVRLELWNSAAGEREKKTLREMEQVLPNLSIDEEVWAQACELARRARSAGITIASSDLLIAACSRRHGAQLETSDSDFEKIAAIP